MKKIGIFPLAGMILCGMVSLSSGLDYYTRSLLFVIPIVFHVLLYYVVYHFIKAANDKKRQNYSFLISIGACASFFLLFLKFILSGFQNIGNHMLKLANNCYSLGLIVVSDKQEEYAALALFAITGVIAVLSLWLYEKEEKMWISALPSLCLFCIPLALDGVPEEWSIVGYGVSFLLLLCVGKRGTFGSGTYCNYSDGGNIWKWMGGSQTLCPRISRANAYDISAGFQSTGGRTKNTGN